MLALRITVILFALAPTLSCAQSRYLQGSEEIRKSSEAIVASVATGNLNGAIKELRPLSVIPSTEFDLFEAQVNSQQANILRQFGSPNSYEFLKEDKLGTRLQRVTYLVFHEKAAIRWVFVFYKAEKGWAISHFFFDGNAPNFF